MLGSALAQDGASEPAPAAPVFAIKGSDTMLQINLDFAQAYKKETGKIIAVDGAGSATGIKGLIDGTAKIAATSRPIKANELAAIKAKHMAAPKERIVAFDSIAVCVHPSNPIDSLSIEQLKSIYGEAGKVRRWDQISNQAKAGEIRPVSRTNYSGIYAAFRKAIGSDFKPGIPTTAGSVALVEFVGAEEAAIGYATTSYMTDQVKVLKLAAADADKPVAPTKDNIRAGKYPLTTKLYYYTVGEPKGEVEAFFEWLESKPAKALIEAQGFTSP